jgi:hypothetical protein
MKLVLRALLARCELRPASDRGETPRRRGITISPADGAQLILNDRMPGAASPADVPAGAAVIA